MRTVPLALAAILALTACSTAPTASVEPNITVITTYSIGGPVAFDGSHVDVDAWAEAAAGDGVVILDVRTPEEYALGHIAGAVNLDLASESFVADAAALDPEASYAVYCQTDNRSDVAIEVMAALGITRTFGLKGGITAWVDAGYAVTTS